MNPDKESKYFQILRRNQIPEEFSKHIPVEHRNKNLYLILWDFIKSGDSLDDIFGRDNMPSITIE